MLLWTYEGTNFTIDISKNESIGYSVRIRNMATQEKWTKIDSEKKKKYQLAFKYILVHQKPSIQLWHNWINKWLSLYDDIFPE